MNSTSSTLNMVDDNNMPQQRQELRLWSSERHERLPAMQIALKELIDSSELMQPPSPENGPDVTAYLEAQDKAPELIAQESDPLLFLNCEGGDCVAASRRLVYYWQYRLRLFGAERAYRPMKVGAAIGEEMKFMLMGAFVRLPNDARGRTVLCFDPSRRPQGGLVSPEVRAMWARCIFYTFSQSFSNPVSQSDGVIILYAFGQKTSTAVPNPGLIGQLLQFAFPIKVSHRHFTGCFPTLGMKRLFQKEIVPATQQEYGTIRSEATVHVGVKPENLLHKLSKHGFEKQSLPASLGGTWDYTNWTSHVHAEYESQHNALVPATSLSLKKRKHTRQALAVTPPVEAKLVHVVVRKNRRTVDHTYRDYSRVPAQAERTNSMVDALSFADRLHHMLSRDDLKEYIWWLPHGRAFQLCDYDVLEESQVLDQYFGISRVAIFILTLHSHDFKQLVTGPDRGSFYHECMLRGLPHLTRFIAAPRDARLLTLDPDNEPPLASISVEYPLP